MDSIIVAAIVNASDAHLGKVIDLFSIREHDTETQEQAAEIVQETYDVLRGNLSDHCVRVLKLLEGASGLESRMIREKFYPDLQLSQEHLETLDSEVRYRLEYI